jgi:hypothetical protein
MPLGCSTASPLRALSYSESENIVLGARERGGVEYVRAGVDVATISLL